MFGKKQEESTLTVDQLKKDLKEYTGSLMGTEFLEHTVNCSICKKILEASSSIVFWHMKDINKLK